MFLRLVVGACPLDEENKKLEVILVRGPFVVLGWAELPPGGLGIATRFVVAASLIRERSPEVLLFPTCLFSFQREKCLRCVALVRAYN